MNEILLLGAVLSLAGSALALLLVREGEIEREEVLEEGDSRESGLAIEGARA
jgi:hypothetical protein